MFAVEIDREKGGRWFAEVPELPGVMAYGRSRDEAVAKAKALASQVLAERPELRPTGGIVRHHRWFERCCYDPVLSWRLRIAP